MGMGRSIHSTYGLFDVAPDCSDAELRKAFCRLLLQYHPDVNRDNFEIATAKTQEVLGAYERLTEWRVAHPGVAVSDEQQFDDARISSDINTGITITISSPFRVSLDRIAALKQELREAWEEFARRSYDVKSALRFVRAAFQGGRPDAADDLLINAKLIDAAPILAKMYSPDEAAQIAMTWAERLRDRQQFALSIQLLDDICGVTGISSFTRDEVQDRLRSIHYGIAQGHFGERQKPSPVTRIEHLRAILKLGFELGYVYKLLAEAFHEMGDDEAARSNLQHAMTIDPQLMGAKSIMKALGLLADEPRHKRASTDRRAYAYRRPDQIPSVTRIIEWLEHKHWDEVLLHADPTQYSPAILPQARPTLCTISAVLGECNDPRAVSILTMMLDSVYWDLRRAAQLALAKIGGPAELSRLRDIQAKATKAGQHCYDEFITEPVAYAEARLTGSSIDTSGDEELHLNAETLLRNFSFKDCGDIGRMRFRLEQRLCRSVDPRDSTLRLTLAAYYFRMNDWTRVLMLFQSSSLPTRSNDPQIFEMQTDVAAALLRAGDPSAALSCLYPVYDTLSVKGKAKADTVLWDALQAFEFSGDTHYTWALRILVESAISSTIPDDLLSRLHRLARVMEPIGEKEMGIWLRHTLRAEAPGHYYGDSHDRLNYFRLPDAGSDFEAEVKRICEEYKPRIKARLAKVLGTSGEIGSPNPRLSGT